MDDFRRTIDECDLRDLDFISHPFTWCNNRERKNRICEQLDRFIASSYWCELFLNGSVTHSHAATSCHYPIWLDMDKNAVKHRGPKPFKFEAMWVGEKDYLSIIEQVWLDGQGHCSVQDIMLLLSKCGKQLS